MEGQAQRMSTADQSHQRLGPAPEGWEAWFFVPDDDVRVRRPSDVALALFGAFLVLITALRAEQIGWLESLDTDVVEDVPSWIEGVLSITYVVGALYVLALIVMVAAQGGKRLGLLRDLLLSGVLAALIVIVLTRWVSGQWPELLAEFSDDREPRYTVLRIAVVTAVIVTAAPHLVRPLRRLGWLIIVLVAVAGTGLSIGLLSDALGAIAIGLASGGLVLVAFGSPRGYPRRSVVEEGFGRAGSDGIEHHR